MPVVSALAQLEHECCTAMKYALYTGSSIRVLQKLFRKRSLNTVPLSTEVCKPTTRILLLRSAPESLWELSAGFLDTTYVHLVIKIKPNCIRVT